MAGNDVSHSLNKHMDMIIQDINFYNKYVNSSLKTTPDLISAIETQTPEQVRERYNAFFNMIENREVTFTEHLGKLETSIESLKQIKKTIKYQIIPEYKKIQVLINKKKMGTLQGLSRQTIAEHHIHPPNEVVQSVFDQSYDESAAIAQHEGVDQEDANDGHSRGGKTKRNRKRRHLSKKNRK